VSKRGALRASDADRDAIVDELHAAATEGRIASDELEQRVSAALKARTYGELHETVADLPRPDRRGRAPARRSVPGWALATVRTNPWLILLAIPVLAVTFAMLLTAAVLLTVLAIVAFVVGGRLPVYRRAHWSYARRYRRPPRRGPGGYWA